MPGQETPQMVFLCGVFACSASKKKIFFCFYPCFAHGEMV